MYKARKWKRLLWLTPAVPLLSAGLTAEAGLMGRQKTTYAVPMQAPAYYQAPVYAPAATYSAPATYNAPVTYSAPATYAAPAATAAAPIYYLAPAPAATTASAPTATTASAPTYATTAPVTYAAPAGYQYLTQPSPAYGYGASPTYGTAASSAPQPAGDVGLKAGERQAIIEDLVRFYDETDRRDRKSDRYTDLKEEARSLYETAVDGNREFDSTASRELNAAQEEDLKNIVDYVATRTGDAAKAPGSNPAASGQPATYMYVQQAPVTATYAAPAVPAPAYFLVPMPGKRHHFRKW